MEKRGKFCYALLAEWFDGLSGRQVKKKRTPNRREKTRQTKIIKNKPQRKEKMQILDHNLKAYKALIKSFKKANRACIVHPTGLGKSYIAYQLIADNPDSTFLVLLV